MGIAEEKIREGRYCVTLMRSEPAGTDTMLTRYMSLGPESMATAREGSLDTKPGDVEIAKVRA
jgi:hypothetical protein